MINHLIFHFDSVTCLNFKLKWVFKLIFSHIESGPRVSKEGMSPYAFLTFGLGPRNCIGSRLALLQLKVAVAHLVRNFVIVTCAKTPAKPEVDQRSVNADAKGGFWVRFEKRAYK